MSTLTRWLRPQAAPVDNTKESRFNHQLTSWLMVAGIILLTVNSARIVYRSIYSEKPFVDEILDTRDYVIFFASFSSLGQKIETLGFWVHSAGIVASGLGGAIFFLGGDLLFSRIALAATDTTLAVVMGTVILRRSSFTLVSATFGASLLWGLTVSTPFALPYWHGFTLNLGELPGALGIGFGLVSSSRKPRLAALIWGLVAWHTKLVYFPTLLLLILASAWSHPGPIRLKAHRLASLTFMFLTPMIGWLVLVSLHINLAEATKWLSTTLSFVGLGQGTGAPGGMHPLPSALSTGIPFSLSHLISRLHDPHLEWSQSFITFGTKLKVVALSLGSVGITLAGLASQRPADRRAFTTLASCALSVMVLAYTYWWFMLHPTMWMRHFQPALYIGLGLWIFWLLQISLRFSLFDRPIFRWGGISLATAFVVWQAYFSWGISTRISDFPTQFHCRIHRFVLVNTVEMTCKKAHKQ